MKATTTIENTKPAAVTQSVFTAPIVAIRTPPMPGPIRYATLKLASYTLLVRSSFHLAVRVAAGSIDSLAAIPAGSNTAPSAANAAITGIVKPAVAAMIGIAATDIAERASEIIDVRRRPNLSTKVPENRLDTSSGTAAAPQLLPRR
ncbi:hypothetical protein GCM10020255_094460 [Rhodococcus baikonurensis]